MRPAALAFPGEPRAGGRIAFGLSVLVVDTHRTFTEVLAARLRLEPLFPLVDLAFTLEQARRLMGVHRHDVLLLDPEPDIESSLRFVSAVVAERPDLVVVAVSDLKDVHDVIDLLARGVVAWVSKDDPFEALLKSVDDAVAGDSALPTVLLGPVLRELLRRPERSPTQRSFLDDLTPRQREVLACLAAGMSRTQIAEKLLLSPHTVRTHVQEVLRRAGVHSTIAAVARAREVGYRNGDHGEPPKGPDISA